ncbi:sulfite exporter TauE/SafE family protein [Nocardioides anomalus]|uniref:Probable membrane transporter protein n=1 Tax=Nocardioides anomalus TaxID=2712223 RepID=A0A6G6WGP4_9ACTN|nr:sulfite exporter TauE/SafE family protein [Nocardioides anomalus]QIG44402.1 sulfite exporter TauE/SafE family protein [Nocardioides anomalus]
MDHLLTTTFVAVVAAGFFVGIVVGLTGMGGGALMTPALIFLGVGDAASVVTADLTAAAVYKTGGAVVHKREGSPDLRLAGWLVLGSVPMALLGPHLVYWLAPPGELDEVLKMSIGVALLFAAVTYALRLYLNLRVMRSGRHTEDDHPAVRPLPTVLVGALGGLLVGVTSVGSGSVIMIALLLIYPGLSAIRLVGTDLVQAVPLVFAAAVSNIALHGLDWAILVPLVLGSVPGTVLGSTIAPRVPQSFVRRGIVVVLTMSGVALLDKAGWAPLGAGEDDTHPMLVAAVGVAVLVLVPLVWGVLRRSTGLPAFGASTPAQVEDPAYRPGGWRAPPPGSAQQGRRPDSPIEGTAGPGPSHGGRTGLALTVEVPHACGACSGTGTTAWRRFRAEPRRPPCVHAGYSRCSRESHSPYRPRCSSHPLPRPPPPSLQRRRSRGRRPAACPARCRRPRHRGCATERSPRSSRSATRWWPAGSSRRCRTRATARRTAGRTSSSSTQRPGW